MDQDRDRDHQDRIFEELLGTLAEIQAIAPGEIPAAHREKMREVIARLGGQA